MFLTGKKQNTHESRERPKSLYSKKVKLITGEHDCLHEEIEGKH